MIGVSRRLFFSSKFLIQLEIMKKLGVIFVSGSDGITPFYSPNLFSCFLELVQDVLPLKDENNAWCTALIFFISCLVFLSRIVLFLLRACCVFVCVTLSAT